MGLLRFIRRKKVGLALGSGGVRGMAHVGVIRVLLENDIPIDYIAGSSIGAFVGAHYAKFRDIDLLEKATLGQKKEKMRALLEPAWRGGFVKGNKVEKLLESYLGSSSKVEDLKIPTSIIAVDLVSGDEIAFTKGPLVTTVRASMCIPGMFEPIKYKNMLLVDGGTTNPVPANVLKDMGADIVISVNLDVQDLAKYKAENLQSIRNVVSRVFDITRNSLATVHAEVTDVMIEPRFDNNGPKSWGDFFSKKGKEVEFMKIGEAAAREKIREIKSLL